MASHRANFPLCLLLHCPVFHHIGARFFPWIAKPSERNADFWVGAARIAQAGHRLPAVGQRSLLLPASCTFIRVVEFVCVCARARVNVRVRVCALLRALVCVRAYA